MWGGGGGGGAGRGGDIYPFISVPVQFNSSFPA